MKTIDYGMAPEIVQEYYRRGICIPPEYWKIVVAGVPWAEIMDGEIMNIDEFNATH